MRMASGNNSSKSLADIIEEEKTAQAELQRMVKNGEAEIYLLLGPPRCGTTATEKFLLDLQVDGQLNEPRNRWLSGENTNGYSVNSKKQIVDKIREFHAQGIKKPKLVVKHTSRFITLDGEMQFWEDICKHIVLLVRNPALSMESHLILQQNAFLEKDVGPHHRLERFAASTSGMAGDNKQRWRAYMDESQKRRDYADIGDVFGINKVMKSEWWKDKEYATQIIRLCLQAMKQELGEAKVAELFAQTFYKDEEAFWQKLAEAPHVSLELMPDFVIDPLIEFRTGNWISLREHYHSIKADKNKYSVVDFSDMQLYPREMLHVIADRMGVNVRNSASSRPEFDVNIADRIWKQGYHPFVNVLKHETIQPPEKTPIPFDRFPPYVRKNLRSVFSIYMELLQDAQRLKPHAMCESADRELPCGKRFSDVDPVTVYAHAAASGAPLEEKIRVAAAHPEFKEYFRLIDAAQPAYAMSV